MIDWPVMLLDRLPSFVPAGVRHTYEELGMRNARFVTRSAKCKIRANPIPASPEEACQLIVSFGAFLQKRGMHCSG